MINTETHLLTFFLPLGEHPNEIRESDYFTERGEFRVDNEGTPTLLNCLMYKLSYYRFGEMKLGNLLLH